MRFEHLSVSKGQGVSCLCILCFFGVFLAAGFILSAKHLITTSAAPHVETRVEKVAASGVGLLLGCAPTLPDGRTNLFFHYRIVAAAELYRSGKIEHLLVSGDNSRRDYDETLAMKEALVALGVPASAIYRDHAGFSTLDSVLRAKEVFGQDELIVISQPFHVERAIYIGKAHGMEMTGYCASDVGFCSGFRTHVREALARVKAVFDVHFIDRSAKFGGDPIVIGASLPF